MCSGSLFIKELETDWLTLKISSGEIDWLTLKMSSGTQFVDVMLKLSSKKKHILKGFTTIDKKYC